MTDDTHPQEPWAVADAVPRGIEPSGFVVLNEDDEVPEGQQFWYGADCKEWAEDAAQVLNDEAEATLYRAVPFYIAATPRGAPPVVAPEPTVPHPDSERLDWLEARAREGQLPNFPVCGSLIHLDFGITPEDTKDMGFGDTIREAIDASRHPEGNP